MRNRRALRSSLFAAALVAGLAPATRADPLAGSLKFEPSSADPATPACHDFFGYACNAWIKANPIPGDQSSWTRFNVLAQRNREASRAILEDAIAHPAPERAKIADYYASCMDEAAIEQKGLAPLQPDLAAIAAVADRARLPGLIAHLHEIGVPAFFSFTADADFGDASRVIAIADQGGLGLPDRDYYFRADAKSAEQRTAYLAHVARMMALSGLSHDESVSAADAVLRLETALAQDSLDRATRRDPAKIYHKQTLAELEQTAPSLSWKSYLAGLSAPGFDQLNVAHPPFFAAAEKIIRDTPLSDLKLYLRWQLIHAMAPILPAAMVDENFSFYGRTLAGAKELEPRWKRCVKLTDAQLGEMLGKAYSDKYFGAAAKERTLSMVQAIERAYARDLETIDWMTPETRALAQAKLAAIANKIGYPDQWRDYARYAVVKGDASGNFARGNAFELHRLLNKIGGPVDRGEWQMTPPTVNAYYEPTQNNINFPAGILQPPFFDAGLDDAANLGAIGVVMGHEMTHGFDDQGRKFDAGGTLRNWWTPADAEHYESRAACLVDQYAGYTAVDDVKLNGRLTLGENTADNGGVRLAYAALEGQLKDRPQGELDGFTAEQRFFLAFAQVWCGSVTPEATRLRALTDSHSPPRFRVNGVVADMPEFASAFGCKAGDPMVRPQVCRVW